jgi:homocysteine S-methyltransferase
VIEKIGRGERIRTSDPLVPNQVLYQAEPLPEAVDGNSHSKACLEVFQTLRAMLSVSEEKRGCGLGELPRQAFPAVRETFVISNDQGWLQGIRVLDGGMATELERRGCDISGPLWSAQVLDASPDTIVSVHLDYLRAGADCISTASYQVSAKGYAEMGRSRKDADRALRKSVELAEQARDAYAAENNRPIRITASLGPYGAALHNGAEYHGRYDIGFEALVAFHAERLAVLADTHADLIAFETVPSLEEARAMVAALRYFPDLAAWVSFTCRDRVHVAHGEALSECAALLESSAQVVAIGINCTQPHLVSALIEEARRATTKPVIVYPNSGEVWDGATRTWQGRSDAARFGEMAREWFAAGAQAVGGCCRTGPAHIAAVCETLAAGSS